MLDPLSPKKPEMLKRQLKDIARLEILRFGQTNEEFLVPSRLKIFSLFKEPFANFQSGKP